MTADLLRDMQANANETLSRLDTLRDRRRRLGLEIVVPLDPDLDRVFKSLTPNGYSPTPTDLILIQLTRILRGQSHGKPRVVVRTEPAPEAPKL